MLKKKKPHHFLYEFTKILITGIFVGLVVYGYGEIKNRYVYKELLREEILDIYLMGGNNSKKNDDFDIIQTDIWNSGLQNGYALNLGLEYRNSARRLYILVNEVNRNIVLWENYKINRSNVVNNKDKQRFEKEFVYEIETKSRFIEGDAKNLISKREQTFWDWIGSML